MSRSRSRKAATAPTRSPARWPTSAMAGSPGRAEGGEITLFKSVGVSLEDLAAAIAVWENGQA